MKNTITVAIKFSPAVTEKQLHPAVNRAIEIIKTWGLKYEVGASCTAVEGELSDILDKVNKLCSEMKKHVERFGLFLDIDYKKGGITIHDKIKKHR